MIRRARPDESAALSALALRSKGHWGYDEEFLEACRDELTYSPGDCAERVFVAADGADLIGFHAILGEPPTGELQALFVDLPFIGHGHGGLLLRHALDHARELGHSALLLDADPGAEPFYLRHGALRVGESPSGSIPGRVLPRLRFDLRRPHRSPVSCASGR